MVHQRAHQDMAWQRDEQEDEENRSVAGNWANFAAIASALPRARRCRRRPSGELVAVAVQENKREGNREGTCLQTN